jgi:FHA domain-containing protein
MPKLILSMDGLVLKEILLNKERITIGRKPHNDVQIDNLAISGEHASITTILKDAFLEDRNSTNGTYVNGQSIKKHALQNNDVIELGKYRLKYLADAVVLAGAKASIDSTGLGADDMGSGGGLPGASQEGRAALHEGSGSASGEGAIRILSGSNAGKELLLTKSMTTLGKPGVQVAVITRRPHGYFISHVEGASFPVVNGVALDAQARRLSDHDKLEIAGVKMEFLVRSAS